MWGLLVIPERTELSLFTASMKGNAHVEAYRCCLSLEEGITPVTRSANKAIYYPTTGAVLTYGTDQNTKAYRNCQSSQLRSS
jgi:hypothetical protein